MICIWQHSLNSILLASTPTFLMEDTTCVRIKIEKVRRRKNQLPTEFRPLASRSVDQSSNHCSTPANHNFLNKIVIVSPSTLTIRSVKIKCPKAVPKLIHKSNQIWLKNINKSIIGKAFSPS